LRLATTLHGLLSWAMLRGNLELTSAELEAVESNRADALQIVRRRCAEAPYCDRKVNFRLQLSTTEGRFTIEQEGMGFEPSGAASADVLGEGNRAFVLMSTYAHEVIWSQDGKALTMIRRRQP
jgi:hypothetical protein